MSMKLFTTIAILVLTALTQGAPTTQQWLQSAVDSAPAGLLSVTAKYPAGTFTASPTPPTTLPTTQPTIRFITQGPKSWLLTIPTGSTKSYAISNTVISNGGFVLAHGGDTITIFDCANDAGSPTGGMYAGMFWPDKINGKQAAIAHVLWDNSGIELPIVQGSAECAIRGKIDDARFVHCTFKAYLQSNGQPWKQVVEIRHGKSWTFTDCAFLNGWPDIGQQKIAGQGYDTSQHVGLVTFDHCRFTRFVGSMPFSRQPGVDRVIATNCIDPSGKTFSRQW